MGRIKAGVFDVEGLPELSRALKAIEPGLQKELRRTNKEVADTEAGHATRAALALGSTAAHVAASIKSSAGQGFAAVSGGGANDPAFAGAEFGSGKFKQFKPWRGAGEGAGYFVWPTIRADSPRIESDYADAIDRLKKRVGLDE